MASMTSQPVRYEIVPLPGENARGCRALVCSAMSRARSRNTWLFSGLCAGIGGLSMLLPPSRATSFVIGVISIYGSIFGLQAIGRANMRKLQDSDPHSLEPHSVEIGPQDIYTGCAHISARYPW